MEKLLLTVREHGDAVAFDEKSIRNSISKGLWPVRTVKLGGRRLIPVIEHKRLIAVLLATGAVPLSGPDAFDAREAALRAEGKLPVGEMVA
jgi:hypothetical protein